LSYIWYRMKHILLFIAVALLFSIGACKKDALVPYQNKYTGSYSGKFTEENSGVDSAGVFKDSTTYDLKLDVVDGSNYRITIVKGDLNLPAVPVDDTGHFTFEESNLTVTGYFVNDSLYLSSKALRGTYDYPQSFLIQQLNFAGKRE
jgi:hypothetical protein